MKIEGYEEISGREWDKIQEDERAMFVPMDKSHIHYFKKAQKFPIVFKGEVFEITVNEESMTIKEKDTGDLCFFKYHSSFPLLVKAVEKAKEVMKKNETD